MFKGIDPPKKKQHEDSTEFVSTNKTTGLTLNQVKPTKGGVQVGSDWLKVKTGILKVNIWEKAIYPENSTLS